MDECREGSGTASRLAGGGGAPLILTCTSKPWPTEQGSEVRAEPF